MAETTIPRPITVADLIAKLQTFDPGLMVMIKCDDDYYSGSVDLDTIEMARTVLVAPSTQVVRAKNYRDEDLGYNQTITYPGGWAVLDAEDDEPQDNWEIVEDHPCVRILADG